ncbi:MAG: AAA family ATPase [Anaerolineae bacterium]
MGQKQGFFVAATGQNIGKTTVCLGLLSGLLKRYSHVGFMKPVGQQHLEIQGGHFVDKDVMLFKEWFHLKSTPLEMSPVLIPQGFTKRFLDGMIKREDLAIKIQESFFSIQREHDFTLVEGTGHVGVGSIIDLNNAQVAALLGLPIILIATGGIGSAFDELTLNLALCQKEGVRVAGIILNRTLPEKKEMILSYMSSALKKYNYNLPIIGCIPEDPFLSNPSMIKNSLLFTANSQKEDVGKVSKAIDLVEQHINFAELAKIL